MSARVLPHNLDAERSILGAILLRNEKLNELESLSEEDFYDPRNQAVFAAMRALEGLSKPIDPITLEEQLKKASKLDAIGGMGGEVLGISCITNAAAGVGNETLSHDDVTKTAREVQATFLTLLGGVLEKLA